MFHVYFAKSVKNGKIYVGSTKKEPKTRVREHNQSSNKWTNQNGHFRLIYYESYYCLKDAKAREKFYKMGFGKKIKKLIVSKLNT